MDCPRCVELQAAIIRGQGQQQSASAAPCPRCENAERLLASARGRFARESNKLKSEIELFRRRFSEQQDTIENMRETLEERVSNDVNALLDRKDQEIKYLKSKLEEKLGKRAEETQEGDELEGIRFDLLETD